MGKETLYRFELSFAGEEQGVGILQGLGDTPIPFAVRDDFFRVFDSLPVPKNISTPDDSQIVFWFTEKGLQQYADVINGIIQELEEVDWQVVAMPLVIDSDASNGLSLKNALYKDEFQVAFSRSDILEFTSFNFKEIACIDINLEDPLVCSYRADEAEYIVCGDDTFEIIDYIPNGYEFWNIGAAMAEGYLPLCRPSQFQPYPGANRIDAENLKAIRLDGAQTVLAASIHGQTTVAAMEEYLERYRGKSTDPSVLEQVKRIEAALEVLKDVKCFSAASKSNENHDQVRLAGSISEIWLKFHISVTATDTMMRWERLRGSIPIRLILTVISIITYGSIRWRSHIPMGNLLSLIRIENLRDW